MKPFTYLTPHDAAEAVGLLERHGPTARVIAGGQSLLLALKDRSERPDVLVSLAGVDDLAGIRTADSGVLVVGATTSYARLTSASLTGWHAEISRVAGDLADRPVRTMGTIGGALCAADPRYDMPALVTGVDARLHILAPSGDRMSTPSEFFVEDGGTSLTPDEILAAVHFPAEDRFDAVVFEKFRQRTFDAAIVSALCAVRIADDRSVEEIRITVGAATPVPRLCPGAAAALVGTPATDVDVADVAAVVAAEVLPNGSDDMTRYRRELILSLTRRALSRALTATGS